MGNNIKFRIYSVIATIINILLPLEVIGLVIYQVFFAPTVFDGNPIEGLTFFRFYTVDSNIVLAIACLCTAIYRITHSKNSTYYLPKWIKLFKLAAVSNAVFVFLVVTFFLAPNGDFIFYFGKSNLFFHLVNPILAYMSLIVLEGNYESKWYSSFIALVPIAIYGGVYASCAVFTKTWPDYYGINDLKISFGLICVICAAIISLISYSIIVLQRLVQSIINTKSGGHSFSFNALETYNNRIFKAVFIIAPIAALLAAGIYTTCSILNYFPDTYDQEVTRNLVYGFDIMCVGFLYLVLFYIKFAFDSNGKIKPKKLIRGKIGLALLICVQWNFISYAFPSTEFWAFAPFFVILVSFFFDYKLVAAVEIEIAISIAISWIINGNNLLPTIGTGPEANGIFIVDIVNRCTCILLSFISIFILTYFGGHFLVKELEKLSDFDALTLLRTRRKMDQILQEAYKEYQNNKEEFCLAMLDIDDFKMVNDKYGHEKGDEVLKSISNIVRTEIHESDLAFRYGGEEILILFKTNLKRSYKTMNRILSKAKTIGYSANFEEFHVTVTAGLSSIEDFKNYEDAIESADNKLYYGKRNGKNQIVVDEI